MKRALWPHLLLALILAACGSQEGVEEQTSDTLDAASPTTAATTVEQEEAVSEAGSSPTVASSPAATTPAVAGSLGDPTLVRERDWVLGASAPLVTLIEYGDFQ